MKRSLIVMFLLVAVLSACLRLPSENPSSLPASQTPGLPLESTPPLPATQDLTSVAPPPSTTFQATTYLNEAAGFALDYPSTWTVNEMVIGERGSQTQFLSTPELANMEFLPEGATRVSATVYQWEPKNDLAAYVTIRQAAWDASGFTILQQEQLVLASGLPAVQFTIQSPDRLAVFMFAALGDQYLEISGEGDLELVKEIAYTLRPIAQ